MLCPDGPDGVLMQNEPKAEVKVCPKKNRTVPVEGTTGGSSELNSYKHPKTWKKSITDFFRNQLRSSRSNDGDLPSGSNENFEETEMRPEQKWQSLGKVFRRQSVGEHLKTPNAAEPSGGSKRLNVKKVVSSYLGKLQQRQNPSEDK